MSIPWKRWENSLEVVGAAKKIVREQVQQIKGTVDIWVDAPKPITW